MTQTLSESDPLCDRCAEQTAAASGASQGQVERSCEVEVGS